MKGARKIDPETIRDFDATKYVKTNMNEYLDKDAHVICVNCVDCIR